MRSTVEFHLSVPLKQITSTLGAEIIIQSEADWHSPPYWSSNHQISRRWALNSLCTFTLLRHLIKANKRDNLLKVWVLLVGFPVTSRSGGQGNLKTLIDFSFRPVGRSPAAWEPTRRRRLAALPPPLPLVMPNCVLQHLFIIDGRHDGYGHNINVRLTQQRHESWPTLFQSRRFIGPPLKSDI